MSENKTWHGLKVGQVYEVNALDIRIVKSLDEFNVTYHDNESGEEKTVYLSSFVRWIKNHNAKLWKGRYERKS